MSDDDTGEWCGPSPRTRGSSGGETDLRHVDPRGDARMVDVGAKGISRRRARAHAEVRMSERTRRQIEGGQVSKGAVLAVARIAGIQAAKRTDELIPLCHSLPLDDVCVEFSWAPSDSSGDAVLLIEARAAASWKTGIEMEALTAAAVAALTVYDMCKSADRGMTIESLSLLEKSGGRSGTWRRGDPPV